MQVPPGVNKGEDISGESSEAARLGFEVLPCFSVLDHTLKRPSSLPVGQRERKGKAEGLPDKGVPMCPYCSAISLQKPQQSKEARTGLSAKPGIT